MHQRGMLPRRRHPLWLVALLHEEPVGLAREEPQIFGNQPGLRRAWIGVRPDVRGRGVGAQLWQRIEAHARQVGGEGLTQRSWTTSQQPEGERFLVQHGFKRVHRELQWWVDPTSLDGREIQKATAKARREGFHIRALRELLPNMEPRLREIFLAADQDAPGHRTQEPAVAPNTFRRVILRNPHLDPGCSAVVLHGDEPVALSWLKGDRRVGRYGVEFTGTAPAWRGRGLATLAKLAALHFAARAGIRWVGTANDESNAPMIAINRRLGHQRLPDLLIYERALDAARDGARASVDSGAAPRGRRRVTVVITG